MRAAILALVLVGCAGQEGIVSKTILPGFLDLPAAKGHHINNGEGSIVVTSDQPYSVEGDIAFDLRVLDEYERRLADKGWIRVGGDHDWRYSVMQHPGSAEKCVVLQLVGALKLRDPRPVRAAIMFAPSDCAGTKPARPPASSGSPS